MFKNLIVHRIGPEWAASLEPAQAALEAARFAACGASEPRSAGWAAPRGVEHGALVEPVGGHWLLEWKTEQRLLPAAVVKRRVHEIAHRIEHDTGRKPGRKQKKEIQEQATLELLPRAFTKQASIGVWVDPRRHLLAIDAASAARADEIVSNLVEAWPGFRPAPLQTAASAAAAMAGLLAGGAPPAGFTVDRECELKSPDESQSVVRYARHPLDIDEVRRHVEAGKLPTRLALTWDGRVSFVLTETMQIRKLAFLDIAFEGRPEPQSDDEAFDADAALATGELARLIPELIDALGGEQPMAA